MTQEVRLQQILGGRKAKSAVQFAARRFGAGDDLRLLWRRSSGGRVGGQEPCAVQTSDRPPVYYDPHTKQYAGAAKLLKGWCPKVRRPHKALHMDFIHTAAGEPVFVEHADNFHDVRERFPQTVTRFRRMMDFEQPTHLTFIVDRGLFKMELFTAARQAHNHIITWEKGYKRGQWDESKVAGSFVMMRPRNSANDLRKYTFRFTDRPWKKRLFRFESTCATAFDRITGLTGLPRDGVQYPVDQVLVKSWRSGKGALGKNGLANSRFHSWTDLANGRTAEFCIVIEAGPIQRRGAEDAENRRERRVIIHKTYTGFSSAILGVLCASAVN